MDILTSFRAKRKLNGNWVFGSIIRVGEDFCQIIPKGTEYDEIQTQKTRVISDTIGQFTGRMDKNKVDVYVGDIIPYHFNLKKVGIVKHGEYRSPCDDMHTLHIGFYLDFIDEYENKVMRKDLGYWLKTSSVIGNIYDNPELLNQLIEEKYV